MVDTSIYSDLRAVELTGPKYAAIVADTVLTHRAVLRLVSALVLVGITKVLVKVIAVKVFMFLYEKRVLVPHPDELKDSLGEHVVIYTSHTRYLFLRA
jgi:hypothetical protein